jgi:hypothetical protein
VNHPSESPAFVKKTVSNHRGSNLTQHNVVDGVRRPINESQFSTVEPVENALLEAIGKRRNSDENAIRKMKQND